jgi:hypothetical protein
MVPKQKRRQEEEVPYERFSRGLQIDYPARMKKNQQTPSFSISFFSY